MIGATYEIYYNASAVTAYGGVLGKWVFQLQNFRSERNEVVEYVSLKKTTFNYHTIDAFNNTKNYSQTGTGVSNEQAGVAFNLYLDSINFEIIYKLVEDGAETSKTITTDINKHCDLKLGQYDNNYFAKGAGTIYTGNITF